MPLSYWRRHLYAVFELDRTTFLNFVWYTVFICQQMTGGYADFTTSFTVTSEGMKTCKYQVLYMLRCWSTFCCESRNWVSEAKSFVKFEGCMMMQSREPRLQTTQNNTFYMIYAWKWKVASEVFEASTFRSAKRGHEIGLNQRRSSRQSWHSRASKTMNLKFVSSVEPNHARLKSATPTSPSKWGEIFFHGMLVVSVARQRKIDEFVAEGG